MLAYRMALPVPRESDLTELSLGLRRRDVDVLAALVERYQYRLTRYLTHLLGRREDVDDLIQETWLRVLERGATFDGRSRFEPWLFTIARNLAIDTTRRRHIVSLDTGGNLGSEVYTAAPVSESPSPFHLAARSEDATRLAHSLHALDPSTREALVLRFQEDLSLAEISAIVGAPVSTIASRIYRALATMRTELEGRSS